ncbi:uncharacterized protein [Drosophila virilis]|uniref:uncharacterized protein isoform X2 n=1 Tax=Drosophila virilis TaxID=7244 RepID=UPI0038B3682C
MAANKNKKKKSKKGQINLRLAHFLHEHLWKICLAIATFDLAHALFFVLQATISLVTRVIQYVLNIGATGNYILGAYGGTVSCGSVEVIEITCIYVVYRYYLIMDPCRLVDEPERGRKKKSRKPLDKKACKESKKKEKKKKKSEKKNKR